MNIIDELKEIIKSALQELGQNVELNDIIVERSKDTNHGDYATNTAMKFCRVFGKSPIDVAKMIISKIDSPSIFKVEIAGPGFINFFVKSDSLQSVIKKIVAEDEKYGAGERQNLKVNVEFVSANPTGLLHVGTARGAAFGDSLCRILDFAGYDVTREYYINDAGSQITHLGESIRERYKELLCLPFELPEDGYHGQDVKEIAIELKEKYGDHLLEEKDLSFFMEEGMKTELARIVKDLEQFRVKHDVFSSEKTLRSNNAVDKELAYLKPYSYVEEGATFLKTTEFLDDKDRVIVKSDGDCTYFLPDIIYHVNKMSRGFDKLIDILGADHHGYLARMKSALMMHGYSSDVLDFELIQMVRFIKDGEEYKASKRAGDAITLRSICDEVGVDAMRYFFAMRAPNSHLNFDMNLAKEQSSNNPVYYAQYAHARLCSVLSQSTDICIDLDGKNLKMPSEIALMKHLAFFPNAVNDASKERAPYKITNYIHELAGLIHGFYTECRVIDRDNIEVTSSRLALCKASQIVIRNALSLIGVEAPTHM